MSRPGTLVIKARKNIAVDISTKSFMLWARHLLSAEDIGKRNERLRNLRTEKLGRMPMPTTSRAHRSSRR